MYKRVLALMLAFTMCFSFAGCGKKADKNASKKDQKTTTATKKDSKKSKDAESEEPVEETESPSPSPVYEKIETDDKVINKDGIVVCGDTAYELYNYVDSSAKKYAKVVNSISKAMGSDVNVYSMIIPTSVGICFPDNKKDAINSSDQEEAMEKIDSRIKKRVTKVSLYQPLMEHRKEYLYFRTDHHWTSLGAYYAYVAYCQNAGLTPHELSEYKLTKHKGFRGSFAEAAGSLIKDDVLEVYHPVYEKATKMTYTSANGDNVEWPMISKVDSLGTSLKYLAFISGDNPYQIIRNKKADSDEKCLVIKESFGNIFVPYLTDHYKEVHVIDYRYWNGSISKFVNDNGINNVLFVNNISMTRNSYLIGQLAKRK
ncbi:MAG: hypothetical protein K6D02_03145 [Lachnospiraceae bacterium]|nr:hypothetical protein [Lachnospiraceae bacterium]